MNHTEENTSLSLVIAIDGPAGSGKSTTARLVAKRLGLRHVDTGAMYRAVALFGLRSGISPDDGKRLGELAATMEVTFGEAAGTGQTIAVGGEDVTAAIRSPEVTAAVSAVSAHPEVRKAMVRAQRSASAVGGVVLEGRDIGTVVLPGADVKVYLVASSRIRAQRRLKDLLGQGVEATLVEVEEDIKRRDDYDSNRAMSPLRRAVGAVEVDTSNLTVEGQVDRIVDIARRRAESLAALLPKNKAAGDFRRVRLRYRLGCIFIKFVMYVFFRLKVQRKLKVDYEENYIYACNHVAYTDPPFIGATLPREVYFLAKDVLFKNRLFGWLIRTFNAIPLRRGMLDRDTLMRAVELLKSERSLMIFPEGGRILNGGLGKPKSGVGYLAVNSGVAVVPVYASGTNRLRRCFFGRQRLRIYHGPPIRLDADGIEASKNREAYQAFSEMVMAAIAALKEEDERHARRQ